MAENNIQFYKTADNPTVYNAKTNYAYSTPEEFFKAGGARDFSNVTTITNPTTAKMTDTTTLAKGAPVTLMSQTPVNTAPAVSTALTPDQLVKSLNQTLYGQYAPYVSSLDSELEKTKTERQTYLDTLKSDIGKLEGRSTQLTAQEASLQVPEMLKQLQTLNTQIADKTAAYNQGIKNTGDQVIPMEFITGQQASLQKQQALDIGALAASQAALQGNYQLAQDRAKKVVDSQFADIEQRIRNTETFLKINEGIMTEAEQKRAKVISSLNDLNKQKLELQKEARTFALANNIQSSFYTRGGTVYRTSDGYAFSTPEEAFSAGVNKDFSNAPIASSGTNNWKELGTDENGNKLYGFVNEQARQVTPYSTTSTANLGSQVGTILGLPTYDTAAANPNTNRSDRNNNAGNIKATSWSIKLPNVIGIESRPAQDGGNFLIFKSPQDGILAIGQVLLQANSYKGKTAEQAIKIYNGGGGYGAADVGLNPNQDIRQQLANPQKLAEVSEKIARLEGYTGKPLGSPTADNKMITKDGYDLSKFTQKFYSTPQGQKTIDNEQATYNSFANNQVVKDFNVIQNKKLSIDSVINSGVGGPADLALVFDFMKALDPNSVVKESEYATAAKSGNIFAGSYAKFNGYFKETGGFLPAELKQAFKSLIDIKYNANLQQYNNFKKSTMQRAANQGLNPYNSVGEFEAATTFSDRLGLLNGLDSLPTNDPAGLGLPSLNLSLPLQGLTSVGSSTNQGLNSLKVK